MSSLDIHPSIESLDSLAHTHILLCQAHASHKDHSWCWTVEKYFSNFVSSHIFGLHVCQVTLPDPKLIWSHHLWQQPWKYFWKKSLKSILGANLPSLSALVFINIVNYLSSGRFGIVVDRWQNIYRIAIFWNLIR